MDAERNMVNFLFPQFQNYHVKHVKKMASPDLIKNFFKLIGQVISSLIEGLGKNVQLYYVMTQSMCVFR